MARSRQRPRRPSTRGGRGGELRPAPMPPRPRARLCRGASAGPTVVRAAPPGPAARRPASSRAPGPGPPPGAGGLFPPPLPPVIGEEVGVARPLFYGQVVRPPWRDGRELTHG